MWALEIPVTEIDIAELQWHFDEPLWSSRPPEPLFDLTPREVLAEPSAYPHHTRRIRTAALEFPLDLFPYGGRWVVLDGLHRLARLVSDGAPCARVRRLPPESREAIRRVPH